MTNSQQTYQRAGTRVPASSCRASFRGAKLIVKTLSHGFLVFAPIIGQGKPSAEFDRDFLQS